PWVLGRGLSRSSFKAAFVAAPGCNSTTARTVCPCWSPSRRNGRHHIRCAGTRALETTDSTISPTRSVLGPRLRPAPAAERSSFEESSPERKRATQIASRLFHFRDENFRQLCRIHSGNQERGNLIEAITPAVCPRCDK